MFYGINIWAVLLAAFLNMVLGGFWYSESFFGKSWAKEMGINMKNKKIIAKMKKEAKKGYIGEIINSILMAWILGLFILFLGVNNIGQGMKIAALAWAGFIFPVLMGDSLWGAKPIKLVWINGAYRLVSLCIMAAVLVKLG